MSDTTDVSRTYILKAGPLSLHKFIRAFIIAAISLPHAELVYYCASASRYLSIHNLGTRILPIRNAFPSAEKN